MLKTVLLRMCTSPRGLKNENHWLIIHKKEAVPRGGPGASGLPFFPSTERGAHTWDLVRKYSPSEGRTHNTRMTRRVGCSGWA